MSLLETVDGPAQLRGMTITELTELAGEIREFLIEHVSRTGGHLGPNLGVVELTIALHTVFESPRDRLLWDTGHQSYVHKLLTGRQSGFDRLRQAGGLSGYPSRAESEHDLVENSHASTALSYADGLARADAYRGHTDRAVVAVIGDGAMTGGMAWEALNNLADGPDRPLVIVLNDNQRSYAPTRGGVADHFSALRAGHDGPGVFEQLGLAYTGPVDGHDIGALQEALRRARALGRPVVVHVVTEKGRGFVHTENNELDRGHTVKPMDPRTGKALAPSTKGRSFTSVFGERIVEIAAERPDVVAITAAMLEPTGLLPMRQRFPDRVIDVGIAEQHAVTMAAGLAMGGVHPVVAVYSTFVNRALDQVLMDVALHKLPVTLVLDRAGVTGPDGPSHHGMWDLSLLGMVPGMKVAAPRDARTLREELREAVEVSDGPTAVRFSRGGVVDSVPAVERVGTVDVLRHDERGDVLLVAVGAFARLGLAAAERLADQGIGVTVVDPRWVVPVPEELVVLAESHRLVVTLEDSGRHGGFGSAMAAALRDADCDVPLRDLGIPQRFLEHGTRDEVLASIGLTAQDVARSVTEWAAGRLGDSARGAEDVERAADEAIDTPRD